MLQNITGGLGLGRILWHDLSNGKWILEKYGVTSGDCIQVAQDKVQWRTFVSTMMNIRFPQKWGIS
jgi:hypothetical protein